MNADRIWACYDPEEDRRYWVDANKPYAARELVDQYVRADLFAALEAEKAKAEAERDRAEWAAVTADGKIRHALPTRFVLVPPDGGNVETLEAVQETVKALDRAEALLAEAVEAVGRLADRMDSEWSYNAGNAVRATLDRIKEAKNG